MRVRVRAQRGRKAGAPGRCGRVAAELGGSGAARPTGR